MPSPPGTTSPHPLISGDPPLQAGLSTWLTLTQIQRIPKWDYCAPRIFFSQKLLAEKVYSGLQNAKLLVNSDHILLGAQITLSFSFFFSPRKSQSRAYFQASLNSVPLSVWFTYPWGQVESLLPNQKVGFLSMVEWVSLKSSQFCLALLLQTINQKIVLCG